MKRVMFIYVILAGLFMSTCAVSTSPTTEKASTLMYKLSINTSPSGAGSVSPPGGEYESGLQVPLTAIPTNGYTFDYWDGAASGSSYEVTIIMDSNKTATAHFKVVETPQVPIPTSASTPTLEIDREKMIEIFKTNALIEWGDDYSMVKYEIGKQTEAYDWIARNTRYPDILAKAKRKWGDDYSMVKYEYEKQSEAYEWIISQTAYPQIMEKAKQKWDDDYSMVKYEYEKQVKAYKSL
ncbi:MAG: hypothetical protein JW901_02775 [Dehalococcoidia bacterium]|nr:hypothetical protein [Dehalococcoidia bacterium]